MPDTITYILPTFLREYLLYGDAEMLEDNEIYEVDRWMHKQDVDMLLSVQHFGVSDIYEMRDSFLACDCSTYTFTLNANRQLIS